MLLDHTTKRLERRIGVETLISVDDRGKVSLFSEDKGSVKLGRKLEHGIKAWITAQ